MFAFAAHELRRLAGSTRAGLGHEQGDEHGGHVRRCGRLQHAARWDTSKVTTMQSTFSARRGLQQAARLGYEPGDDDAERASNRPPRPSTAARLGYEPGDDDGGHVLRHHVSTIALVWDTRAVTTMRSRSPPSPFQLAARLGHELGDEHAEHVRQRRGLQQAAQLGYEQGDDDAEHVRRRSAFNSGYSPGTPPESSAAPGLQPAACLGYELGDDDGSDLLHRQPNQLLDSRGLRDIWYSGRAWLVEDGAGRRTFPCV